MSSYVPFWFLVQTNKQRMARKQGRLNSICYGIGARRGYHTSVIGLRQCTGEPELLAKRHLGGWWSRRRVEQVFHLGRHVGILDEM